MPHDNDDPACCGIIRLRSARSNGRFGSETSQTALAAGREKYHQANGQSLCHKKSFPPPDSCPLSGPGRRCERGRDATGRTALVGREEETELLLRRWAKAKT